MISKYNYILLFFCFLPIFIQGQETEEFIVSFEPLIMKDIDTNYHHLADSIPRILFYEFQNYPFHKYSEEEIVYLKSNNRDSIRKNHLLILSDLIEKRDMYMFSGSVNKNEFISIGEKIEEEQDLLDNLDYENITDPESVVPIRFIIGDTEMSTNQSANSNLSNLIVKGSLEKLDDWIYLQIQVKNTLLDTEVILYETISSPDAFSEIIPEIITELKTVILGRSWTSIKFDLEPKDSNIIIKSGNKQIANQSIEYLDPGVYYIEITNPGYSSENIEIDLAAFETRNISVTLELEKQFTLSVQSFPAGADLYSGATWIGNTPILMENPILPALLTFKLEGYNDSKFILKEDTDRDIQIFMQSAIIDNDMIVSRKRNRFYQSFSYFLLSIPVSLVSYGMSSDYGYAYNREIVISPGSAEAERLKQLSTSWYNVYLGGIFINFTLFVDTIIDLVDYIKSNDHL